MIGDGWMFDLGTEMMIGKACDETTLSFDRCDEAACNKKCKDVTKDSHAKGRCMLEDTCKCTC